MARRAGRYFEGGGVNEELPGYDEWKTRSGDDEHSEDREPQPCEQCNGEGRVAIGEHFVTHDMASDACEPEMEGMSMGVEYELCQHCGGSGEEPGRAEEKP
jgi:DnaJ-class molecular chaperone